MRPALNDIRKRVDASEYGGAPLLGINGTCIIGHGSSTPKAIKNAIHMAQRFVEERVSQRIQEDIERNGDIQEVGPHGGGKSGVISVTICRFEVNGLTRGRRYGERC